MTEPSPYTQPVWSPDGQWWWDGTAWQPAGAGYGYGAPAAMPELRSVKTPSGQDVLGILSLVVSFVGVISYTSLIAVVLGHVARARSRRAGQLPSTISLVGLIVGYLGIALQVILTLLFFPLLFALAG